MFKKPKNGSHDLESVISRVKLMHPQMMIGTGSNRVVCPEHCPMIVLKCDKGYEMGFLNTVWGDYFKDDLKAFTITHKTNHNLTDFVELITG